MQQHVYCLGYVSLVLVMYSLSGLVLYSATRKMLSSVTKNCELYYSLKMVD